MKKPAGNGGLFCLGTGSSPAHHISLNWIQSDLAQLHTFRDDQDRS